ncbi:hypothetical protein B296_00006159 [Ensete ventricosum]|uniref:Uncharacterized protein n=1 Tax=Ensete ventricosum TaxID=4639 RepID=A0A426ZSP4_ENSVE|nr:hypothetical protein B296_00006159 [Ensete ventricosum]
MKLPSSNCICVDAYADVERHLHQCHSCIDNCICIDVDAVAEWPFRCPASATASTQLPSGRKGQLTTELVSTQMQLPTHERR